MEEQGTSPRESYRIEWEYEGRKFAAVGPDIATVVALYAQIEREQPMMQYRHPQITATMKVPLTPEKPAEPTMPAEIASVHEYGILRVVINKRGLYLDCVLDNLRMEKQAKELADAINVAVANAIADKQEACAKVIEAQWAANDDDRVLQAVLAACIRALK